MRIGIANSQPTRSIKWDHLSSGYDNIAFTFGQIYWNIDDARNESFDLVLIDGNACTIQHILKGGREKWKKLFMIEEAGISVLNQVWYLDLLRQLNPDGFLVHSRRLIDEFMLLKRPVIAFYPPYPFRFPDLAKVEKNPNKVCLYLQRFQDPASNFFGTLEVFRRLPSEIRGVTFIDQVNIEQFKQVVSQVDLADRIDVLPVRHWPDYLKIVADCKVFISMDNRHTYGRFDLDAAHLGIASVGAYTETKFVLFPDCLVDCTDINGCVDLVLRERERVYSVPGDRLTPFNHNEVKNKLLMDLDNVWKSEQKSV